MLKILPTFDFENKLQSKCGEIFCHNFNNFTIFCTLCEVKLFQFEDFILHLQNVHLKNNSLKIEDETNEGEDYTVENVHLDSNLLKTEDGIHEDNFAETDEELDSSDDEEEDVQKVLKDTSVKHKKKTQDKEEVCGKRSRSKVNNQDKEANSTLNAKKSNKDTEYICLECDNVFSQKKALDQHVRELHNGYKCSLCDKRFRRSCHLADHLKTHKNEKKFICPMENCARGFTEEIYLKRHLEVHTMERTFHCDYENCGKSFHTQRRLNIHKYTHRMPKKLVCEMCGHACRSNTELTTHQRVHTGEKPFSCETCSKPFISKTALAEHMISHLETRPHVCAVCNAAFANRRVLVRHSFIHTDEKTFKCKICDKAFKHPNSLQGHIRHVHRKAKIGIRNDQSAQAKKE